MKEVKIHINSSRTPGSHTQSVNDTRDVLTNRRTLSAIVGSSLATGIVVSALDHAVNSQGNFNPISFAAEALIVAGQGVLTIPMVIYMFSRCMRAAGIEVNDGDEVDIRGSAISPNNVRRNSNMERK